MRRREVKGKGERKRHTQLNAEFQRIARKEKSTLLHEQCNEIEENNKMGNTRDLMRIGDIKGTFHERMGIAIPLLGIHTEETRIERDKCTPVFISTLFIIARTWKQPRCPSAEEWIRKLWYIYTMEYYSSIKKNTFESVLMRWMKLEPIIHSEVSQKEKHQYSILMHIYGI